MIDQETIRWEHLALGRMAKSWTEVGPMKDSKVTSKEWARQTVAVSIHYGLTLWNSRNVIIHGSGGGVSKYEIYKTEQKI